MNLTLYLGLAMSNAPRVGEDITIADLSRPALALAEFYNTFGDSTTIGVSAATNSDWPSQFRASATADITAGFHGGTGGNNGTSIVDIGNGGIGGENTTSIAARVVGLSPTYVTELARTSFFAGGLNDYNSAVSGWARDWPAQVKTNYATAAGALTGGKRMFALLAPQENNAVDGARWSADHRFHQLDMATTYGELAVDKARYLRFTRELQAPSGTADADALAMGQIPYKYRGSANSTDFADVDFAVISGAGAPSDLNHPEGTIYNNTTTSVTSRKYGASGAGSWSLTDTKHFSKWGNAVIKTMAGDIAKAEEGTGPPFVPPVRLRVAADAAVQTLVGTVPVVGTATKFSLRTYADGAVTDFGVNPSGEIYKLSASVAEGETKLVLVAENTYGTLLSPVDIFITRPSTVTAPVLRTIASPYISVHGRDAHGMADGKQVSGAFYVNVASLAASNQLAYFARTSAPTQAVNVNLTTGGALRITIYDNTNTLVGNISATGATVTTGSDFWITFALDFATNTRVAYINEAALTVAAITNGGNIPLADCNPQFLAVTPPIEYKPIASPLTGKCGFLMFTDGYIDWSNSANRRLLYATDTTPATRTPYAAIGGVTPKMELWGGVGDWLWGTPDGSNGPQMLCVSHRARTLLT